MRLMPLLRVACLSLMLSACVAPLLMSPASQLMGALLTPLVGFDPNEVDLFEQPLIKERMVAVLGPDYDNTMQLLRTANELRQEGPLFYVLSRYSPVPEVASQAGMVWNAQNNLLSVMLQQPGGGTRTFGEGQAGTTPTWPGAMQAWQTQAAANALGAVGNAVAGQAISGVASKAQQGAAEVVTGAAEQAASEVASSVQRQAEQAVADAAGQVVSAAVKEPVDTLAADAGQARADAEVELEKLLD